VGAGRVGRDRAHPHDTKQRNRVEAWPRRRWAASLAAVQGCERNGPKNGVAVELLLLAKALDEGHRSRWRPHLAAPDEEHEARTRPRSAPFGGFDPRQVIRVVAGFPRPEDVRPAVEGRRLVPGRHVFDRALKPRIDELARDIGDGRILVRVGVDDRNPMLPQQLDEGGRAEAVVASLDNMPELPTLDLAREDRQGSGEVLLVEALRRRELPQDRPEVFSEFGDAARQGPLDRRTGLGEVRAIGRVTRALESKDEPVRRLARHFRKLADFCVP
jgi:hypothetical protein